MRLFDPPRRVTILVGAAGVGKTELALALARQAALRGLAPCLVDLDVVKPYFRIRDVWTTEGLDNVMLISPPLDTSDLPIVHEQARGVLREGPHVFVDVGGQEPGLRALASLRDGIDRTSTAMYLVVNFRRPLAETVEHVAEFASKVEEITTLYPTALISNTHLLDDSTVEVLQTGLAQAEAAADRLGLAVAAIGVLEKLLDVIPEGWPPVVPLGRLVKPEFQRRERRKVGPPFGK